MGRSLRRAKAGARSERLLGVPALFFGRIREPAGRDWTRVPLAQRRRMARWAVASASIAILSANFMFGVETFLLVQLAFNGGQMTFETTLGAPNFPAVVVAIVLGMLVNVLISLRVLKPQLNWFVSGSPADHRRRRAVQRIPLYQVYATMFGWATAVGAYLLFASDLTGATVAGVSTAFALAGLSSACITYVFAERAARPLSVVALQDFPAEHVLHGVHGRLLAVWAVSSAVPMGGLLILNAGRWMDLLPPVHGAIDWATVVLAAVSLTSGVRVVALVGTALADPLTDLRRAVEKVDRGDLANAQVAVYDTSELGVLQHGFNQMVAGLDERERMRELFARHVGDTVAELALKRGAGMHGTNAIVGVLFVDIVGSTSIAAQQDPQDTVDLLNRFFTIVADVVDNHGGIVNKFEGDAALAVFGVPVPLDDPAGAALAAARDLAVGLGELPIEWGIGVSHGMVFAGNVGAERRYEYTVIGDPVNECARLSEMAKTAAVPVLAADAAIDSTSADERGHWRSVGARMLRGRPAPTEVYVPSGMTPRRTAPNVSDVLTGLLRPGRRGVDVGDMLRRPFDILGR